MSDHSRTTQPRAGEWFRNPRDIMGLALLVLGVVGMVVTLAAAANARTEGAIWTGIASVLAMVSGATWLFVEGRRVRRAEMSSASDVHDEAPPVGVDGGPMRVNGFPIEGR